jgi:nicotinamidase-related amidase
MLKVESTVLVVIDVQEKLARAMHEKEKLVAGVSRLIRGVRVFGIPVLLTEQNPDGLGKTLPEIKELLPDADPVEKISFSCAGEERFLDALKKCGRKQVLLAGIEAHVCIYQTAVDLKGRGYEVQVAADAISSRTAENLDIALDRLRTAGVEITSVESALFELLGKAEGEKFKEIVRIVK